MRVLSVIHSFHPAFSGEGEWWLRVVPVLRQRGVEVEVLTAGGRTQRPEYVGGVAVHRVPLARGPGLRAYAAGLAVVTLALRRLRRRFDLVLFHAPNNDAAFVSCVAGRLGGWKTLYKTTLLGSDDLDTLAAAGRLGRARVASLGLAHGVISLSRVLVGSHEGRPWLRDKLLVVPQGVDVTRFRPADALRKSSARRQLGLPVDARVALFCGALIRRKGVDLLVEAWREVSRQLANAVLVLVGPTHESGLTEPEDRRFSEAIVRRIRELGLSDRVRLAGYQRGIDTYYTASDVFVLPSRFEGWGTVITEAMASALPCVLSDLHGIADEHIDDRVHGFVVRSEEPHEYARHLLTLLTCDEVARDVGARARRRAEERFSVERSADAYAAFFHRVLGDEPASNANPPCAA
jgi:glycosyltransferase involved in cell wall biosynthesis